MKEPLKATVYFFEGALVPMKPWKRCLALSLVGRECTRMKGHRGEHMSHRFKGDALKRPVEVVETWSRAELREACDDEEDEIEEQG